MLRCTHCNKEFIKQESKHLRDIKAGKTNFYCSNKCVGLAKVLLQTKQNTCKYCSNKTINYARVCEKCRIDKGLTYRDYSNVSLQDLISEYSRLQYHAKLRGHSRSVFDKSKKEKSCYLCNYNIHVDICHIIDVKDFSLDSLVLDVNNIINLVALCKNCHFEFDNDELDDEQSTLMKNLTSEVVKYYANNG